MSNITIFSNEETIEIQKREINLLKQEKEILIQDIISITRKKDAEIDNLKNQIAELIDDCSWGGSVEMPDRPPMGGFGRNITMSELIEVREKETIKRLYASLQDSSVTIISLRESLALRYKIIKENENEIALLKARVSELMQLIPPRT